MAAKKTATKAKAKKAAGGERGGLSAEERAAMRDRVKELREKAEGDEVVLARIAKMPPADRALAKRFHEIVKANAPDLVPKTWYGMPAYTKDGKVLCFFQDAAKFKARYATFGFNDNASLDDGELWATSFALRKIGPSEEAKIAALVKKAAG